METVERRYLGIAGSDNSLARNVAFVLGTTAATVALFMSMSIISGHHVTGYVAGQPGLFLSGFHIAFFISIVLVIITWILGLLRLMGKKKQNKLA